MFLNTELPSCCLSSIFLAEFSALMYLIYDAQWQFAFVLVIFWITVYPKKYAQGFCFAVLWRGYALTDYPISTRLTSLALWQSNDCPSASKATLMNMDKYFMWIHYERLHNHNKAKHNKTVCIFLGIYCILLLHYMCIFLSPKRSQTEKIGNVQDEDNLHIEQNLTDLQIMLSFLHQSYEFVLTSLIMAVNQR